MGAGHRGRRRYATRHGPLAIFIFFLGSLSFMLARLKCPLAGPTLEYSLSHSTGSRSALGRGNTTAALADVQKIEKGFI